MCLKVTLWARKGCVRNTDRSLDGWRKLNSSGLAGPGFFLVAVRRHVSIYLCVTERRHTCANNIIGPCTSDYRLPSERLDPLLFGKNRDGND
jgi:hypothetical protein